MIVGCILNFHHQCLDHDRDKQIEENPILFLCTDDDDDDKKKKYTKLLYETNFLVTIRIHHERPTNVHSVK